MCYGQQTMGVAPSALLSQRRAAASALHIRGHGDLDLTLALAEAGGRAGLDPAFEAHAAPIGHWTEAVWCSWLPLVSGVHCYTDTLHCCCCSPWWCTLLLLLLLLHVYVVYSSSLI